MIRFEQRAVEDRGTERIFKKLIHPGQNAIKLVDRDGIPLRPPNSATISRLQSSYVLSPRGVPTRRSNHSYSGQLSQGKMHPLVSSLETQEMLPYNNRQTFNLSSAGSSTRHYIPVNTPSSKKRTFGSGPPRNFTAMSKIVSSARSSKYLSSDDGLGSEADMDHANTSPQNRRLEKEWSALSQCRALKRSSERPDPEKKKIVSHRVDRMYFMTGNSMKLQQKYHVEDDDLKQLKELSDARAASRQSRNSSRIKGDIYRPNRSARSTQSNRSEPESVTQSVNGITDHKKMNRKSSNGGMKENNDPSSNMVVSQKALTPKPSSRKSPLQGWASEETPGKKTPDENGVIRKKSLHEENTEDVEVAITNSPASPTGEQKTTDDINVMEKKDNSPSQPIEQSATGTGAGAVANDVHDKKSDNDDNTDKKDTANDYSDDKGNVEGVQNADVKEEETSQVADDKQMKQTALQGN